MSVWFVKGIPDDRFVKALIKPTGRISFSTGGSINLRWKMEPFFDVHQLMIPGPVRHGNPQLIVNEISNPETHSEVLTLCERLCEDHGCPVINHPKYIPMTMRDVMAARLSTIPGLVVPRTIRANPKTPSEVEEIVRSHDLGNPFLMREIGKHGGETLLRISLPDDRDLLHQFAYDGRAFYLTEFVDYPSDDGLYRKLRIACIDGEIRLRHLLILDNWMVHASARAFMDERPHLIEEELPYLENFENDVKPKIAATFAAICKAVPLDYFGVDCHVYPDGKVLLFEANANMNMLINTRTDEATVQPYIDRIVEDLRLLLVERMSSNQAATA